MPRSTRLFVTLGKGIITPPLLYLQAQGRREGGDGEDEIFTPLPDLRERGRERESGEDELSGDEEPRREEGRG